MITFVWKDVVLPWRQQASSCQCIVSSGVSCFGNVANLHNGTTTIHHECLTPQQSISMLGSDTAHRVNSLIEIAFVPSPNSFINHGYSQISACTREPFVLPCGQFILYCNRREQTKTIIGIFKCRWHQDDPYHRMQRYQQFYMCLDRVASP